MILISREDVQSTLKRVFEKYNIGFGGCSGGFSEAVAEAIENIPTICDMQDKCISSEVPPKR